jgi:hypothetical protein
VVAIAAQPFVMEGFDGTRIQRHVPDLLLGMAGGAVAVVDVKPAHRLGEAAVVEQMAWTARVCAEVGWGFELWSGADAVLVENVRFLAGFRRANLIDPDLIPPVLQAAAAPVAIGELERVLAAPTRIGLVRPAVLHLLWSGRLSADLHRMLGADTLVRSAGLR